MPAMTKPTARPFHTTVRFRAANGASVAVTVDLPVAVDETGRALAMAREAIAQLAAGQAEEAAPRTEQPVGHDDCGAGFWSWATPEGWRRPGT
jgi:hypothetical protein